MIKVRENDKINQNVILGTKSTEKNSETKLFDDVENKISLGSMVGRFQKLCDQNCNKKNYKTKLRPLPKLWDQNCNKKSYGTKLGPLPKLWDQKCTLAKN